MQAGSDNDVEFERVPLSSGSGDVASEPDHHRLGNGGDPTAGNFIEPPDSFRDLLSVAEPVVVGIVIDELGAERRCARASEPCRDDQGGTRPQTVSTVLTATIVTVSSGKLLLLRDLRPRGGEPDAVAGCVPSSRQSCISSSSWTPMRWRVCTYSSTMFITISAAGCTLFMRLTI